MTLDEAIEALRVWARPNGDAILIPAVDEVLAAYDAERAAKAKQCEPWCGTRTQSCVVSDGTSEVCFGDGDWCFCGTACKKAGRPVNPKVTP